ncbi:MAG: pantetheine-phosphate adenylyltransferase [Elusimicrobiota bacterium]|jgi:pantetheine-phosphate adenylyltransferase|nr:pantetheine-phosphate adenylyltransferase [Elusimicrobiota bacterium]
MKSIAIYPGTFDPFTNGHLDIVKRAAAIFDKVVVAVLINGAKKPIFSVEERVSQLKECLKPFANVEVESFDGLLADYMTKRNINVAIRGLRAVSDLEYEFQIAHTNRMLKKDMETVFLMPSAKYTYLTSTIVREVYSHGGRIKDMLPENVERELIRVYGG